MLFSPEGTELHSHIVSLYQGKLDAIKQEKKVFEGLDLVQLLQYSGTRELASELLNHHIFFKLIERGSSLDDLHATDFYAKVLSQFHSMDSFYTKVLTEGTSSMMPGWLWVHYPRNQTQEVDKDQLVISFEERIFNPLSSNSMPILCLDLWEHAYILDYWERVEYIKEFFNHVDWGYVNYLYSLREKNNIKTADILETQSFI